MLKNVDIMYTMWMWGKKVVEKVFFIKVIMSLSVVSMINLCSLQKSEKWRILFRGKRNSKTLQCIYGHETNVFKILVLCLVMSWENK